jgi:glycosyltransferase involved in cell wall biosynthesis
VVLGLWNKGLPIRETTKYGLEILRLQTMAKRRQKSILLHRFMLFRRIVALLSLIQYMLASIIEAWRLRPDHVCCHNAIMLPAAWAAAKFSNATLEYLPHELETHRNGLTGINRKITIFVERKFIYSARNVIVVCDPIKKWYEDAYGLANVQVVRNVPEKVATQIRPIPEGSFRERFDIPNSAKVFIYQGLLSEGRGIEVLIDAFTQLAPEKCHLVLMGYGDIRYQALVDRAAISHANIHYHPPVAREWIISYSASADIGIFISERASLSYRYALPNKFFEWAHAGLPVLVSDNLKYQAQLVRQGGFGWAAPLDELTSMIHWICEIDHAPFAKNARRYALPAVWEEEAKIFSDVYQNNQLVN